ncbi:transcription-repair coupling factor [Lactiplantibacillus fabifermentans]|uniref:Transcription-repair-coupling factor n=2 Tax=Lactiplantibacillus fabifermentans TaxID=483011 RepID=A0A0R2NPJ4_9LACO|nr:transcription-repair coupling factor [Lactiplantibacillus fabifermentans]ETY75300.1 transcription-repair coupling factor [Lactiplantibacillus fabifermentans T30PCM01]KRO27607.1 transcription-repair coupling factor [Lactiplantibacillus fabifermentans DSM 21115]
MDIEAIVEQTPDFQTILAGISPASRQLITGLNGSARTVYLSALFHQLTHSVLIVADNGFHASQMVDDLTSLLAEDQVFLFPAEEMVAAEVATSSPEYRAQRVQALNALLSDEPAIVVTSIAGARRFLPPVQQFQTATLKLVAGTDIDLEQVQVQLHDMGYVKEKLVARPGDFAVRGSIIDIYPLDADYPIRVDLFDTEIDTLKYFDPETQRSVDNLADYTVLPATDFILTADMMTAGAQQLQNAMATEMKKLKPADKQTLADNLAQPLADMQKGIIGNDLLLYGEYLYGSKTSIFDYVAKDGVVVFDEYSRILDSEQQLVQQEADWITDQLAHHKVLSTASYGNDIRDLLKSDDHAQVLVSLFQKGIGNVKLSQITNVRTRPMQEFFGQLPALKTELDRWHKMKQTVVLMVSEAERLTKVSSTLDDFEIDAVMTKAENLQPGVVQIVQGTLQNGFEFPDGHLIVVTEQEMFKKVAKKRPRRQTLANAERLKSYTDLKPGDFVVHVNHGIGKYVGMETLEVDGVHQDYITIAYQNNAKIFIPVTQLNLVQKYVSSESKTPHINKLGGTEWTKAKRKVAAKIEDIADELVDLYAKREAEVGYAFPKDDSYQDDFDNEFPYPETPDQLRSIAEIKHDMERPKPMDRLLVGDVGYGKTEVALRAAFKAIEAGKQVAFLVPTTILAQQHYETMLNRFEGYPVNVGMLSRFRTNKEMKTTVEQLKSGELDIVVGTHRLLSKDVSFADLGLLIIDEEQRFGVKHKERLKALKSSVDVLTLTATPIPRTLHMSMLGVRDLSVIETPPTNRYPIQTYVMEQNFGVIKDGIEREMQRNGQVFYLHNRVNDIEKVVAQIKDLVPDAAVAHIDGQMPESQLEGILYDFIRGEYDVLVTTTIIETGVDIPNVNTLFVENADHMGLSQLYQLRGRIGRSSRVAYAYFTYQQNKVLTEVGEKRLQAIKDFTELGSGFKIAMRDLSIRGAGNLLGKQQHGFIDSVGYDLYTQMLSEAVAKKRGQQAKVKTDAVIELGIEAYLPTTYIEDERQKIEIYKRIRQLENDDQYLEVEGDLIDRFGDYPVEVAGLLAVGKLKMLADDALIEKIRRSDDELNLTLSKQGTAKLDTKDIFKALAKTKLRATVGIDDDKMKVKLVIQPQMSQTAWLEQLTLFVEQLGVILTPDDAAVTPSK